jgi:hypothetical protein
MWFQVSGPVPGSYALAACFKVIDQFDPVCLICVLVHEKPSSMITAYYYFPKENNRLLCVLFYMFPFNLQWVYLVSNILFPLTIGVRDFYHQTKTHAGRTQKGTF